MKKWVDNLTMGIGFLRSLIEGLRIRRKDTPSRLYNDPPVSYASNYPDVPPPEPPMSPQRLALKWVTYELPSEKMPAIAADLLMAGMDTPALRRLAGEMSVSCRADVEEIVERMFNELSVPRPRTETEAKLLETRQIAREVIAGERNAWAAASHLEIVVWGWKSDNPTVERIFRLNDEINWDEPHRRPVEVLTTELIETFASLGASTTAERRLRGLGALRGKGWIADDFDDPLPEEIQAQFEAPFDPPLD